VSDLTPVVPGLHRLALGPVNAYLLEADGGLVLIDTGSPGSAPRVLDAVRQLGYAPSDVEAVVVTHLHPDHAGALADVLDATGAEAWMHPWDAAEVRAGNGFRPVQPASGVLNWGLDRVSVRPTPPAFRPAPVRHEVRDGDPLPGGLQAVWAPGHSQGQIALVWPAHGGVLVAADACTTLPVLTFSVVYEDLGEGRETLRRLAALEFETAVFGHGKPIVGGASAQFRETFGT
jgi:glyoxylase-like metal-dependent hydrolase (beta-lactamase superfamily II)